MIDIQQFKASNTQLQYECKDTKRVHNCTPPPLRRLFKILMMMLMLMLRNCLVGPGYIVKVTDTAMFEPIYAPCYYDTGDQRIPIRWMPWEAVTRVSTQNSCYILWSPSIKKIYCLSFCLLSRILNLTHFWSINPLR